MKKISSILAFVLMTGASIAQTNWKLDASHSKMGFSVTHMMVSEVEGKFKVYEGLVSSKTETDFTDANIMFTVDVASVNTDDEKRDGHLKSPDFFDAAKFPKMSFKGTSMKAGKVKGTYTLTGDLTIRDVTKKVTFTVKTSGKSVKDPYGNIRMGFAVTGSINRKDFGLTWNAALEAGGVAVSELVKINCSFELIKS